MQRKSLMLVLLGLAATQAHADPWAYLQQSPGKPYPKIHVYSDDGTQFDRVGDDDLSFHVDARGQCDSGWRTQHDSYLKVKSGAQDVAHAELDIDTDNRSYGPNHGSSWKSHSFQGLFRNQQIPAGSAHHYCNAVLASEAASSPNPAQRRRELLAQGFTRTLDHAYTATFNLQCMPENPVGFVESRQAYESTDIRATLVCHGNPDALDVPLPPAQRDPVTHGIKAMDLWSNPSSAANYTGFCPKTIHFGGEIDFQLQSSQPFELKYRYVARWGVNEIKSPQYTTTYTASGNKILHSWPLGFPLAGAGLQIAAPTASNESKVFGGSVVLEFIGPVPIHANLQPVQFDVTCLTQGTVNAPLGGGGSLATPTPPREIFNPSGQQQPARKPQTGEPVTFTAAIPPPPATRGNTGGTAQLATPAAAKPDLVIRSATPAPGTDRALRVRVANLGAGPAPATHITMFLPDGTPVRAAVGAMGPRGHQDVVLRIAVPLPGLKPLRLQVDEAGRVAETDERNNTFVVGGGR